LLSFASLLSLLQLVKINRDKPAMIVFNFIDAK
jgi:hypothetical protein